MSKTIKKAIPSLRFPEFINNNEWENKRLGEIGEFVGGGTPDTNVPEYWDGEIQWFTPTEIKNRFLTRSIRTITQSGLKNSSAKLLPEGALLICTRAKVGDVGIAKIKCTTNQGFQSLVVKDSEYNLFWYYWLLQHKKELLRKASGSTFIEIGKSEISNIISLSPVKQEQQKIAACLSSLDDIITAETQKLVILQAHKKGLLQNLFPAEGETVPRLRFKEFEGSGEWEENSLGKIGNFTGGGTPSKEVESFWTGDIPWISSSDIDEESIRLIKISRFISKEALQKSATKLVPVNSILLVSRVGVGKLAVSKNQICTSQDFTSFTPEKSDVFFIAYYLKSKTSVLIGYSQGMAIKGFTKDDISKFCIYLPSITEQQKIASSLSSLDEMILSQKQKVGFLNLHKKALLQGLFPNTTEINA